MKTQIETIKRTIRFYELSLNFLSTFQPSDGNQFRELFQIVYNLAKTRANIRYQQFGEKSIFIQDVKINPKDKTITGKLRCVRNDILPEIMNTKTDEARGIDAKDEEGLVETTHFLIDYNKKVKRIAMEHNQFGAKIGDFVLYLQSIGINKNALKSAMFIPIVRNNLNNLENRLNRCSEFTVKVHKDNIEKIKSIDTGTYTACKASIDQFKSDYATLFMKFDYRKKQSTGAVDKIITNLIRKLRTNPSNVEFFETLEVRAEDEEKGNRLETFDLLSDHVKSVVHVEKKVRYRTVISVDIFEKMQTEMAAKRFN